jgi:uncharacterized protein YfaS (alpha-2-macroglobulin family)
MTAAAYLAYQRATTRPEEAEALAVLGQIHAAREEWGRALKGYRTSLQLAEVASVRKTYADLEAAHGFKPADYKVDSDTASPRVCFRYPEALATGRVDFSPFVVVSGIAAPAITTEDTQLCVEGLKHGERHTMVLRPGLPAASGNAQIAAADYEIYVRDRAPMARFTGRNYVLPRTGQEGIPVVSVNTGEVAVEVYRIGDRSLLPTLRSEEFLSQLSRYSAKEIGSEKGLRSGPGRWRSSRSSTARSPQPSRCSMRSAASSPASTS